MFSGVSRRRLSIPDAILQCQASMAGRALVQRTNGVSLMGVPDEPGNIAELATLAERGNAGACCTTRASARRSGSTDCLTENDSATGRRVGRRDGWHWRSANPRGDGRTIDTLFLAGVPGQAQTPSHSQISRFDDATSSFALHRLIHLSMPAITIYPDEEASPPMHQSGSVACNWSSARLATIRSDLSLTRAS